MKTVTGLVAAIFMAAPSMAWAQAASPTPTIESICEDAKLTLVEQAACRGEMQLAATEAEKLRIRLKIEEQMANSPRAADEPKAAPDNPTVLTPEASKTPL